MEEGSGGGAGGTAGSSSSTLLSGGGRQRFEVELKPGETTIVSWKKLIKDANKAANNNNDNKPPPVPAPPVVVPVAANPVLDSRIAPPAGGTAANEANDAPPGSRFSAVIEKIERLYMGKNSSDEEDLNDVPDDDEYDTEDSFIDDTELDDYFQVDNSAIKHDGFFVNRGKLERTNEGISLPTEQPKKRRRKDTAKGDDGHVANKQMKVSKKEARKVVTSADKNTTTPSRSITLPNVICDDVKLQSPIIALGTVVKKPSDPKNAIDPSPTIILNGEAKATMKSVDKQKAGVLQSKKHGTKLKDGSSSPALPIQRVVDKGADVQSKSQGSHSEDFNQSVLPREKNVIHQQADIKASETAQQPKNTHMVRKEGSSTKPKSTSLMLEKAIRDLEKIVAETRPPSMEVPEADNSSQAVKRRMPPEIKQKLAKVARLAHAIHGKLSKELVNRLMSILGHLIQLRSLKRNLHNMVVTGLSAKEEKEARLQQLKKEVDEMVKIRAPMMKSEAIEQQAGSSDDFQETSTKEKVMKNRFTTDDALEDKICDVYDLFVDGLDEDAGPLVRKLYAELAELWPKGFMDNHGIKRAICRAKDRKKALNRQKGQDNLKRKKLLAPKTETVTVNPGSMGQVQHASDKDQDNLKKKKLHAPKTETLTINAGSMDQVQHAPDKLVTEPSAAIRSISNTLAANTATRPPNSMSIPSTDRPKQEKIKGGSNSHNNTMTSEVLAKKKAKKKADAVSSDTQIHRERSSATAHGDEKHKSHKEMVSGVVKPASQPLVSHAPGVASAAGPQPIQPTVNNSGDMI